MPGIRERLPCGSFRPPVDFIRRGEYVSANPSRIADFNVDMSSESFRVCVMGRLHGVTRQRLAALVAAAGGRLVRSGSRKVNLLCIAQSSAPELLSHGS